MSDFEPTSGYPLMGSAFIEVDPRWATYCPVTGKPRSSQWEPLSKELKKRWPICCFTGMPTTVIHHIRPWHLFPELELDENNLAPVADWAHLYVAHVGNYSHYLDPDKFWWQAKRLSNLFKSVRAHEARHG